MIKVATRKSKLAQIQADIVIEMITEKLDLKCEKKLYTTKGDSRLDVSLDKLGGKGLFIKELEIALLLKEADIAVHSMKDVPTVLEEPFEVAAIPVRDDARDAFVSLNGEKFLKQRKGARIGTSSIRRAKQLLYLRQDIEIVPIRGNVETRLQKIEKENLDGIVLAAAALKRLGLEKVITEYFEVEEMVPACGQGAIAVESLKNSEIGILTKKIDNYDIRVCIEAERIVMKLLNGGCHSPVAAFARIEGEYMEIIGVNEKNGNIVKSSVEGRKEDYINLAQRLATKLAEGSYGEGLSYWSRAL
ncbi:MAG: hydroxymethylbilane synthase [Thermovenabulum sp.]|uniref:hydroxymethylbilane synthase n=1 Tax=Thermovenabulum sp. TaxID=3100335 RepID=UPI003C7CC51F